GVRARTGSRSIVFGGRSMAGPAGRARRRRTDRARTYGLRARDRVAAGRRVRAGCRGRQPDGSCVLDPSTSLTNAPQGPSPDRLLQLIDDFAGVRVAVFGDLLADEFIYGRIARVSREAPVLILDYDTTEIVPGGAGNAAKNVAALGGVPTTIGVAGSD